MLEEIRKSKIDKVGRGKYERNYSEISNVISEKKNKSKKNN